MKPLKVGIIPDTHVPNHDEEALACAVKILGWYKPDKIVFLGDFLDYDPLSRHNRDSIAHRASVSMEKEFEAGNRAFDRITKHCQDVVYIKGNHEDRAGPYVDQHPEVRGLVEVERGLEFSARRKDGYSIRVLEYNEVYRTGHLHYTHGWYTNQHHAQKHLQSFQVSIVYGHIHDYQVATYVSPISASRKHTATCLGCLCTLAPDYMRNAPNKWVHCVGLAHIREDGDFGLDPVIICGGKASYAGKVFSA